VIKVSKTKCLMGEEETYEEGLRRLQRRDRLIIILGALVAAICLILNAILGTPAWVHDTLNFFALLGALSSVLTSFTSATRWEMRQEFGQLRGELGQMRGELGKMRGELRQMREDLLRALGEIRDLLKRRK
jgi:hypothetical protein